MGPMRWVVVVGVLVGCGGEPDPAAPPPVDPKVACETRAAWSTAIDCVACQSYAAQPPCTCDPSTQSGTCYEANVGKTNACAQSVIDCVKSCKADCTCVDACYQGAATCRSTTATFEGCIVQTCSSRCTQK